MASKRRQHSAEFKFRVALATVREMNTDRELASKHDLHPTLIRKWKRQLLEDGAQGIVSHNVQEQRERTVKGNELHEQIGRLKMELEWSRNELKFGIPRSWHWGPPYLAMNP